MDADKFLLSTDYPMDKVLHTGTATIVNDGNTTPTGQYQFSKEAELWLPNPTGRACFIRFMWRVGAEEWQSSNTRTSYGFNIIMGGSAVATLAAIKGGVTMGCTANDIYIRTINASHGDVFFTPPSTYSYSPISRTFTIKYALYSME